MINNVLKAKQEEFESNFFELDFPLLMDQVIAAAPWSRKIAAFFSIMPVLSVYCTRLRVKYFYDNYISGCQLMVFVIGAQSTGKGALDFLQNMLASKLLERDGAQRAIENDFRLNTKEMSDRAKAKLTPPTIAVMVLPPSTSRFQICSRASDHYRLYNDTLFFYQTTPELDAITDAYDTKFADLRTVSRMAYDLNALYGIEHKNIDGINGFVNINASYLFFGTQNALNTYFNKAALMNGNISRSIIVGLEQKIGDNAPVFKDFSDADMAVINTVLDKMMNNIFDDENGGLHNTVLLNLDFLRPHVEAFQEVARKEAIDAQSWAVEDFRKRSSLSAFRIAAICFNLYNLSNELLPENKRFSQWLIEKNTTVIYNFCAYFTLNSVLGFYGNKYDNIIKKAKEIKAATEGTVVPIFDTLPDTFSKQRLENEIEKAELSSPARSFISKWLKQDRIEDLGDNTYRKIKK